MATSLEFIRLGQREGGRQGDGRQTATGSLLLTATAAVNVLGSGEAATTAAPYSLLVLVQM